jgi:hypothetical protein
MKQMNGIAKENGPQVICADYSNQRGDEWNNANREGQGIMNDEFDELEHEIDERYS